MFVQIYSGLLFIIFQWQRLCKKIAVLAAQ
jgi:hypothetical protein